MAGLSTRPAFLLLLIILLPITTNLYGTFGATPSIALLYSVNLAGTALAQLFLSFWLVREEVPAQTSRRQVLAVPIYVSGVFVAGPSHQSLARGPASSFGSGPSRHR